MSAWLGGPCGIRLCHRHRYFYHRCSVIKVKHGNSIHSIILTSKSGQCYYNTNKGLFFHFQGQSQQLYVAAGFPAGFPVSLYDMECNSFYCMFWPAEGSQKSLKAAAERKPSVNRCRTIYEKRPGCTIKLKSRTLIEYLTKSGVLSSCNKIKVSNTSHHLSVLVQLTWGATLQY